MRYLIILLISFNSLAQTKAPINPNLKVAYFASGCFWCVEAIYESIPGVEEVISGYAGSSVKNPTYRTIKDTGHAETVAVYYHPNQVNFKTLVKAYYDSQDPTTVGQKPDFGKSYRSIIFYNNAEEQNIAWDAFKIINKKHNGKAVTSIEKIGKFYPAEDYHQDFEKRNPNHPYIKAVSIPRLNRFKEKFFD
ncbi:peptide-methionine (S)-S-oxide reductase MsrA [Ochrovirga pacifica]|uniref:peptide-methionine (S)-S-oxide reductase MsrA n=1 Tax=Ochrovirga pacifica TaxID=1042376 RepID=UPI0002557F83|nr:peptide-methionine (S)-S-oxide reductase MsrA [Ochrovirga pacifica]